MAKNNSLWARLRAPFVPTPTPSVVPLDASDQLYCCQASAPSLGIDGVYVARPTRLYEVVTGDGDREVYADFQLVYQVLPNKYVVSGVPRSQWGVGCWMTSGGVEQSRPRLRLWLSYAMMGVLVLDFIMAAVLLYAMVFHDMQGSVFSGVLRLGVDALMMGIVSTHTAMWRLRHTLSQTVYSPRTMLSFADCIQQVDPTEKEDSQREAD